MSMSIDTCRRASLIILIPGIHVILCAIPGILEASLIILILIMEV